MGQATETLLATIPGQFEGERIEVVLSQTAGQGSQVLLRQQSWGDGVGWFTQNSMSLDPDQIAALRLTLGATAPRSQQAAAAPAAARPSVPAGLTIAASGSAASRRPTPLDSSGRSSNDRQFRLVRADSA